MTTQLILASSSPRRRELLTQIGIDYKVQPINIDERVLENELPSEYIRRISEQKARSARALLNTHLPILAADTAVVLDNTIIMGKPENYTDAYAMLQQLSGKVHKVYSGVFLLGKAAHYAVNITQVQFKLLTDNQIKAYCETNEPYDKAGSYAIQGLAAIFIETISGSFSGVMGLPLFETSQLLAREGIIVL